MFAIRTRILAAAALAAGGLGLFTAGAASAQADHIPQFAPNFTFADGARGFALTSRGGPINPGVIVGFNPQPDPPGDGDDGALIALLNPANPMVFSPATGPMSFRLILQIPGDGSVIPLPAFPDERGATHLSTFLGGHTFDIDLRFVGEGPLDRASWGGFNPQPEPPGDVLGGTFAFAALGDPQMFFDIFVDGQQLSFDLAPPSGAPEPATWDMLIGGFLGAGAVLRWRRRTTALD